MVGWLHRSAWARAPTVLGPSSSRRLISRVLAAGRSTEFRRTSRTSRALSTTSSLLSSRTDWLSTSTRLHRHPMYVEMLGCGRRHVHVSGTGPYASSDSQRFVDTSEKALPA